MSVYLRGSSLLSDGDGCAKKPDLHRFAVLGTSRGCRVQIDIKDAEQKLELQKDVHTQRRDRRSGWSSHCEEACAIHQT